MAPSRNYDVISEIRLCQSMRIYLQNIAAEFHPDLMCNGKPLGFFKDGRPMKNNIIKNNNNNFKMSSDMGSVPDPTVMRNSGVCIIPYLHFFTQVWWHATARFLGNSFYSTSAKHWTIATVRMSVSLSVRRPSVCHVLPVCQNYSSYDFHMTSSFIHDKFHHELNPKGNIQSGAGRMRG